MGSSRLSWGIVLLFLVISLNVVSASDCSDHLASFQSRIERMAHYEPEEMTGDSQGNMDMMMKKKRGEENDLPTNCLKITEEAEGDIKVETNCESHKCIEAFVDLVQEFDEVFSDTCSPAAKPDFVVDPKTAKVMATLRTLSDCNKCVVTYTKFQKLEAKINAAKCMPTADKHSCDSDCVGDLKSYYGIWDSMMQGICRKNMPGGCGDGGGMTEGEIWDKVDNMHLEMNRVTSAISLCDNDCEPKVTEWVGQWAPLIENGCISSDTIDLAKANLVLADYKLNQQCGTECKERVEEVGLKYVNLPAKCKVGLLDVHRSDLVNSVNSDRCEGGSNGFLDEMTLAKGFFTLTILGVGAVVIYFVSVTIYNRVVKGKRSALPTFSIGKSSRSGSKNTSKRNQYDDEEEVVLYDADMDDDRL